MKLTFQDLVIATLVVLAAMSVTASVCVTLAWVSGFAPCSGGFQGPLGCHPDAEPRRFGPNQVVCVCPREVHHAERP